METLMVALPSERGEITALTQLHGDLYAQVEAHFDHSYLPRLLMDGLAKDLPEILTKNTLLPESDGDNYVVHVGSVKLILYKNFDERGQNLFGIQMMAASGPGGTGECIAVQFYCSPRRNILVEWTVATKCHGPNRFIAEVSNTAEHPLNYMLWDLYQIVGNIITAHGFDKDAMRFVVNWAKHRQEV